MNKKIYNDKIIFKELPLNNSDMATSESIGNDITVDNFEQFEESYKQEKRKYASDFKNIEYMTPQINQIGIETINMLRGSVSRDKTVDAIDKELNDMESAICIEAGIFEFALIYSLIKNITDSLIPSLYNDKTNEIINSIQNIKSLKKRIQQKSFEIQQVAFMSPSELNPPGWADIVRKNKLRDYKKKNMAATDLYKCYKCGESRCQIIQLQTRSADEPMTNFITCLVCHHQFKK